MTPSAEREQALELFATGRTDRPWIAPLLGEAVLGIDPSLTGFAICYHVPGKPLHEGEWSTKPAELVRDRMERYEQLIRGTLQLACAQKPDLVLIEGYAFEPPGKQRGHHDRAELGGVLRWKLCELCQCPIVEVAPSSLKKFACGDGKAPKSFVVSAMAKQFQRRFVTDNQADAFALCQLGLALTGQVPPPATNVDRAYLVQLRKLYGLHQPERNP